MKAQVSTSSAQSILSMRQLCHAYYELTKPRVVALIVFTAVVGMFLSIQGMIPLSALIFGGLGIGLAAASGAAFNHLLDRRADRLRVVIKSIRGGKKATAEVWDNPEGLEWTVPSPAPYHTFATAPEVR